MNQPLIELSTVIHIIILSREMPFLRTSFSVAVTFKNSIKNNFQAKNIHMVVQVIQVSLFVLFFDYMTDCITNLIASIRVQLQLCLRKSLTNSRGSRVAGPKSRSRVQSRGRGSKVAVAGPMSRQGKMIWGSR